MQTQLNMTKIEGWAKEIMLESGGLDPILWVEGEKKVAMVGFPTGIGDTSQQRSNSMFELGKAMAGQKNLGELCKVYFVHEGWALDVKEGEEVDHMPSEDPDRIEVLLVAEYDAFSFKTIVKMSEIVRDEDEELLGLRDLRDGEAESHMIEAFVTGYEAFGGRSL